MGNATSDTRLSRGRDLTPQAMIIDEESSHKLIEVIEKFQFSSKILTGGREHQIIRARWADVFVHKAGTALGPGIGTSSNDKGYEKRGDEAGHNTTVNCYVKKKQCLQMIG